MKRKIQKKKMGSKLFSGFLAALMVVTVMAASGINSQAGNTADTWWDFNISTSNSSYSKSTIREKKDDSAFYIHWQSTNGPTSIYVQTYGSNTNSVNTMTAYNYIGPGLLSGTGRYSVSSYVYENLHGTELSPKTVFACFGVKSSVGSGYIGGYWSPDSSGSYSSPIR